MKHTFNFNVTLDPRKHGAPYVAKLVWKDRKIEREFFNLKRQYGKKEVTVWGTFEAEDGDIIEMREGASWKNDYRNWYLVWNGDLYFLTDVDDSQRKRIVIDYISGELAIDEMVSMLKVELDNTKTTKEKEQIPSETVS